MSPTVPGRLVVRLSWVEAQGVHDEIKAAVNKWLKDQNITCRFSSETVNTLAGTDRNILRWETDALSVWMHYEHSDKTSWIDATVYKRP